MNQIGPVCFGDCSLHSHPSNLPPPGGNRSCGPPMISVHGSVRPTGRYHRPPTNLSEKGSLRSGRKVGPLQFLESQAADLGEFSRLSHIVTLCLSLPALSHARRGGSNSSGFLKPGQRMKKLDRFVRHSGVSNLCRPWVPYILYSQDWCLS